MIENDILLGSSIAITSLALVALTLYQRADTSLTDKYILLNLGVAVLAAAATYNGFFDTFQQFMEPITGFLAANVGVPPRWTLESGIQATRWTPTDIIRVLVIVPVLLYAAYRDIKERVVHNWVWYPLFFYGITLLVYDLYTGNVEFLASWVFGNITFALIIGFALYKTRLFGGADMKALWGIALLIPTYPTLVVFPWMMPPILPAPENAINMFSLTIFTNTVLVAIFWPLKTLVQNIRNGDFNVRHPGLMLTARRVNLEHSLTHHGKIIPLWTFENTTALGRFKTLLLSVVNGFEIEFVRTYLDWHRENIDSEITSPADIDTSRVEHFLDSEENTNEDGERIWDASNTEEATEAFEDLLSQETVWMTPGIPFIVPMLLGVLLSLIAGDIIYWLVVLFG